MGSTPSVSVKVYGGVDIPEEPSFTLPPTTYDCIWSNARLEDMFDLKSAHLSRSSQVKSLPTTEISEGETEEIADSVSCLAHPASRTQSTVARLSRVLSFHCREEDHFTTTLAQRLHFLRCMHAAMVRAWPRDPPSSFAGEMPPSLGGAAKPDTHRPPPANIDSEDLPTVRNGMGGDGWMPAPKPQLRGISGRSHPAQLLPHNVFLGIELFFTLINCMHDECSCIRQRSDFVRELVPLVKELPALSLANISASYGCTGSLMAGISRVNSSATYSRRRQLRLGKGAMGGGVIPSLGVLDKLRDFLFSAACNVCLTKVISSVAADGPTSDWLPLLVSSAGTSTSESSLALPVFERTLAVEGLVALACSRGSLVDLLLAVQVLLNDARRVDERRLRELLLRRKRAQKLRAQQIERSMGEQRQHLYSVTSRHQDHFVGEEEQWPHACAPQLVDGDEKERFQGEATSDCSEKEMLLSKLRSREKLVALEQPVPHKPPVSARRGKRAPMLAPSLAKGSVAATQRPPQPVNVKRNLQAELKAVDPEHTDFVQESWREEDEIVCARVEDEDPEISTYYGLPGKQRTPGNKGELPHAVSKAATKFIPVPGSKRRPAAPLPGASVLQSHGSKATATVAMAPRVIPREVGQQVTMDGDDRAGPSANIDEAPSPQLLGALRVLPYLQQLHCTDARLISSGRQPVASSAEKKFSRNHCWKQCDLTLAVFAHVFQVR